jgi:hypothetical protein
MRRFNVFAPEFTYDDSRPEGYKAGNARLGPAIGSSRVSATVYSDKLGVWPNGDEPAILRRELVDYWDGEG